MSSILGPEWHISSDGVSLVTDNGNIKDKDKIYKSALNFDLKEICSPMLTNELSKDKTSKIILQIQKIRNISAPKANEESQAAPRMLKLTLTDGDTYVQALEIGLINAISRNKTPPGTKVLISSAKITSGCLLLNPSNCTILGGRVPHLVEKWEIAKSVQRNHRSNSGDDGPPPWVNFGTKIQNNNQESNFKSLGKNKDSVKENSEFELQRQGAIAEATSGATKKVFSGRVKQNIQPAKSTDNFKDKREHRSKAKFTQKEEISEKPQRPSEKVSLFSFLEDKLPVTETQSSAKTNTQPESNKLCNLQKGYQNQAQQQNKEFNFPREKPLNQNNRNQFENPYNNRNNTLHREKSKSSENRVYPTSQAKSDNNQISQNVYNDFNIPERLQRKQTDKSNSYGIQNSFENRNNNSFDRAQPKSSYQSQYSQKKPTNDFHQNSNQTNAVSHFEASDRLAQKPRDNKDFNHNQNNGYNQDSTNRSQHKQNDNRYSSTSRNNNINRYETSDHKPSEKKTSNANNKKYSKYPTNNSSNTNYLNSLDKPQQKIDDSNTSETISISQNEINDVANSIEKISVNSQFASRSLRQYLNLGQVKKSEISGSKELVDSKWKIGDDCLAKYWEDGQFYDASITAITDKTFAVKFKGYGNIEEILKSDCLPVAHSSKQDYSHQNRRYDQNTRQHSGSMEFRRSSRNYK
nr:tudor domain-containing protein 3 [Leptinotarsa decemlineata]